MWEEAVTTCSLAYAFGALGAESLCSATPVPIRAAATTARTITSIPVKGREPTFPLRPEAEVEVLAAAVPLDPGPLEPFVLVPWTCDFGWY
jgi:hypothetical protein